jgi:hypothetical protein
MSCTASEALRSEKRSSKKRENFEGRADTSKKTKGFEGKGASKAQDFGALKGALDDGLEIPHSDKRFAGFSKESEASKGALEVPVVVESSKDPQDGEKGVPEKKRRRKNSSKRPRSGLKGWTESRNYAASTSALTFRRRLTFSAVLARQRIGLFRGS